MSPLTVTSVASAAIISGDLIIGLSDGSIINCGRVQGPQGLDGPAGPIGAPGLPGRDGNTILTSEGLPRPDVGTNGDYIIDKVSWTIYGPKASGVWGIGTPLRGNGGTATAQKRDLADGVPTTGDGNGGGRAYNTSNLPLSGLGRTKADSKIDAPGGNIIPEGNDLKYQSNLNRWIVNSFVALDDALPVSVGDVLPDEGEYEGDLFLKDGILYIYTKGDWIAVGGESGPPVYVSEDEPPGTPQTGELWYCTDEKYLTLFIYTGTTWAPAAPPVSLDGIEDSLFGLSKEISEVNNRVTSVNLELEQEVAYKAGDRANNLFQGHNEFDHPVRVAPGTQGNEAITYEQLANLSGEIDEIKVEKEKGEWIAEIPSTGSDGGRDVIYDGKEFPGGGVSTLDIGESGGPDGKGFVYFICDLADDPEGQAMAQFLTGLYDECLADAEGFRDKYSFYCPWAADKGLAVREQPIESVEKSSAMTYTIHFYGPVGEQKEASGKGIEFFTEANEGHRPPLGHFFMEAYQDKSAQEQACAEALAECQTGDPLSDSACIREFDTCMENASDGWKPVSEFEEATAVVFHKSDRKNITHSFDEVRAGDSVRITDTRTEHFLIAKIDSIKQTDQHIRFAIDNLSHIGGIEDGSFCQIEFYNFDLTPEPPDLDAYVKKTGDVITGSLKLDPSSTSNPLTVNANDEGDSRSVVVNVRGQTREDGTRPIIFNVIADGRVNIDDEVKITSKWQVTHKKYVDEKIAEAIANIQFPKVEPEPPGPARLCWEYRKPNSGKAPSVGCFWLDSDHFRFSYKTHNNINLGKYKPDVRNEWGAPGAADNKGAFEMTVWKKYDDGWYMYDHIECSDTRWSIENEGIKHFQFKKAWRSHKQSYSTGTIYYITVGGFF